MIGTLTPGAPAIEFGDPRLPENFWSKAEVATSGCWEWKNTKVQGGYGRFGVKQVLKMAHRVAYEALIGPIPDGLKVLHNCDNPPCVNPAHLRAGTQAENMQDRLARGRNPAASKTHCKRGHAFTPENTYIEPGRGSRQCRKCRAANGQRRRQRNTSTKAMEGIAA
ncbi:HNH endonuclease signature motif containing protein [Streptomyces ureilyticus]|uniref:HNH endonuclease n=1 Tax=Streptomyces ureilyticus TaxID=1775131 RepID=A0ABX0DZB6_9ACTN|nr:HNH endonuclease signature motif containing protein [Streptomyces ureilyticus]NGO47293.1 HNH endonuclease [Streptomyces ureilyticus]